MHALRDWSEIKATGITNSVCVALSVITLMMQFLCASDMMSIWNTLA